MSSDFVSAVWKSETRGNDDNRLLSHHIEDYVQIAKACIEKMSKLWNEIEFPRDNRQREFEDINEAVRKIWDSAVDRAEKKKDEYQQQIDEAVKEIYKIKEDLGESPRDSQTHGIEGLLRLEQIVGRSLHSRYEAVQNLLKEWQQQRAKRETEFKNLLSQINNLRIRFGDVVLAATYSPRKSDISSRNLQKLSEELEECRTEKMKRERHLAALLSKLRSICLQLGENDIDIAAMAHPSLRFYREALPDQFTLVRPSFSNQPGLQRNVRPEDIELDLSDETFTKLEAKIDDVFNLKATREKQTQEVAEILRSLWDALNIPEDDLERGIHVRALEGPTKLHLQSIEKCKNEVRRLEKTKAKQLWDLIDLRRTELEHLCEETKLPMPNLCQLLAINSDDDDDGSPVGKISDALSKLTKMIEETRSLSEKREPILNQIAEIERSRAEVAWLSEYEKDEDRYRGRDSTKKLNRALKAGRMKDKLPDMIKLLRKAIALWEQEERSPFVYEGQDYNVVLENLQMELQANQQPRNARERRRNNPRGRTPPRAAYTPPPPHAPSPSPSLDIRDEIRRGPSNLPQYPGASSRSRSAAQNKKVEPAEDSRHIFSRSSRHFPDNTDRNRAGLMSRPLSIQSGSDDYSISSGRPPRMSDSRQSADTKSITPSDYELLQSPLNTPKTPQGLVSYNPLFPVYPEMAVNTSSIPSTFKPDLECRSDASFNSFGLDEIPAEHNRSRTDTRLSRRSSPRNNRRSRNTASTASGGTRSTGSSHRSLAFEKTEGKPC